MRSVALQQSDNVSYNASRVVFISDRKYFQLQLVVSEGEAHYAVKIEEDFHNAVRTQSG